MTDLNAGERAVLTLLWDGRTQKEIAALLGVTRRVIDQQSVRIRRKLRAATLIHASRQAVREGILQP
ncbi:MAG: hypothetical protein H8K07_01515 [Nitrospira sp.]|nr:hypothetical protein [Nitrospira sp.]